MARQFVVNGETLVEVRGGCHMSGNAIGIVSELGLTEDQITISPIFKYKSIHVNDFGPDIPADMLTMLASVKISMTLVNYDPEVLDICVEESMGGFGGDLANPQPFAQGVIPGGAVTWVGGTLTGAGTPLGGLKRIFDSGWHYISVNLTSPVFGSPWTFPKCYLSEQPVEIPLGTQRSKVKLEFTALPYYDPYISGTGGLAGTRINGIVPYPNQPAPIDNDDGALPSETYIFTLRGDVPSSGAVLWTRVRDRNYQIPMQGLELNA